MYYTFLTLPEGRDIKDITVKVSLLKSKVRGLVKRRQALGDEEEWHAGSNFNINITIDEVNSDTTMTS